MIVFFSLFSIVRAGTSVMCIDEYDCEEFCPPPFEHICINLQCFSRSSNDATQAVDSNILVVIRVHGLKARKKKYSDLRVLTPSLSLTRNLTLTHLYSASLSLTSTRPHSHSTSLSLTRNLSLCSAASLSSRDR
ncbi:hypothetical protein P8452_75516 [Trifolium repens]|nr:hypothetical protein P8452_75516 [Trifolium repens]